MNDQMHNGMAEATRLTQQGRLEEATAAIQRALAGKAPVGSSARSGGADEPIEVVSRLTKKTQQGPAEGPRASGPAATQAPPGPTLRSRGVQRPPGMATGRSASVVVPKGARFLERSYTNDAGTRSYKLYVPSGYQGQAVPLIVMLHGCTQDPDDFAAGTRMNALAEEHTFLV
nr:PHB depolymerase family esterase [Actinomycetota bacterium]